MADNKTPTPAPAPKPAAGNAPAAAGATAAGTTATAPTKTPIQAAQEARRAKGAGKREEVHSKEDFVSAARAALESHLGIKLSNANTWDAFKVFMNVAFSLAVDKPLSLSGIGRFAILISQRSEKLGKPAKRMRFKSSQRVQRILNDKTPNFLADLKDESDKGKTETTPATTAAATPATPAAAAPPATATPAAAPASAPAAATPPSDLI